MRGAEFPRSPSPNCHAAANDASTGASIDAAYRSQETVRRLWHGVATYLLAHNVGLMFGTAGFPGAEPIMHPNQLAYLRHTRLAPPGLRPQALPERFVEMDNVPAAAVDREAPWGGMPLIVKGYLRLGSMVGRGAVVNNESNTVDVCLVTRIDRIPDRYRRRYRWRPTSDRPRAANADVADPRNSP